MSNDIDGWLEEAYEGYDDFLLCRDGEGIEMPGTSFRDCTSCEGVGCGPCGETGLVVVVWDDDE